MTHNNLGNAFWALGQRESGTARLKAAVAAWDGCLPVIESAWPPQWVQSVRFRRDAAQAEIGQRSWAYRIPSSAQPKPRKIEAHKVWRISNIARKGRDRVVTPNPLAKILLLLHPSITIFFIS
jgi:hypothetical protein